MIQSEALTHGSPATFDPDYDFLGVPRKARQYCLVTHKWYEFTVYGTRTPSDRAFVSTPDTLLEGESWGEDALAEMQEKQKRTRAIAQADLQMEIVGYLMAHGMASASTLAIALERKRTSLLEHIRPRHGKIYCRQRYRHEVLFGVVGVHDKETP